MELHDPRSNASWDRSYCTGFITYPSPFPCIDMQEVSGHYKNSIIDINFTTISGGANSSLQLYDKYLYIIIIRVDCR